VLVDGLRDEFQMVAVDDPDEGRLRDAVRVAAAVGRRRTYRLEGGFHAASSEPASTVWSIHVGPNSIEPTDTAGCNSVKTVSVHRAANGMILRNLDGTA
jgi:hypothetical protein